MNKLACIDKTSFWILSIWFVKSSATGWCYLYLFMFLNSSGWIKHVESLSFKLWRKWKKVLIESSYSSALHVWMMSLQIFILWDRFDLISEMFISNLVCRVDAPRFYISSSNGNLKYNIQYLHFFEVLWWGIFSMLWSWSPWSNREWIIWRT